MAAPISPDMDGYDLLEFPPRLKQLEGSTTQSEQRRKPLMAEEFNSFFDKDGRLVDESKLMRAVFKGGIDPSIRKDVWKFLFNFYPMNSTYSMLKFHEEIFQQLDNYRQSGEFCELSITVGQESFSVHTNILAAASPLVKEALKTDEYTVKIDTCMPLGFSCFLDFVYRGKLTFDPLTVLEALQAAEAVQCQAFREECVNFIKGNINEETCLVYIQGCTSTELSEIRELALKFLYKNLLKASDMDTFAGLPRDILEMVLQNEETTEAFTVMDLVSCCIKWCQKNPDVEPVEVFQLLHMEELSLHQLDTLLDSEFIQQHRDLEMKLLQMFRKQTVAGIPAHLRECTPSQQDNVIWAVSYENKTIQAIDVSSHELGDSIPIDRGISVDGYTQSFAVQGSLYLLGGESNNFTCYNRQYQTWKKLASARTEGGFRAIFCADGKTIYTVGVFGTRSLPKVDRYMIQEDRWEAMKDAPVAASAACVVDGRVFISGGHGAGIQIHEYHTENDTWTKKCNLIHDRNCHFTCAFNSKMYVMGGFSDRGFRVDSAMEVYDPVTNQCTELIITGIPSLGGCHREAIQVCPGVVYIYESDTDNLIVIDLKNNTSSKRSVAGLAARKIDCVATFNLEL